ncbi:MAG TPA: hypothetical protein VLA71_21600 [Algoriphagus sp.]|nr:hypothetical protein [Algoriphagus sp.]
MILPKFLGVAENTFMQQGALIPVELSTGAGSGIPVSESYDGYCE